MYIYNPLAQIWFNYYVYNHFSNYFKNLEVLKAYMYKQI